MLLTQYCQDDKTETDTVHMYNARYKHELHLKKFGRETTREDRTQDCNIKTDYRQINFKTT